MKKRTLVLRREALTELTPGEMHAVVGGLEMSGKTCPLDDCFEDLSHKLGCVGTYNCPTYTC